MSTSVVLNRVKAGVKFWRGQVCETQVEQQERVPKQATAQLGLCAAWKASDHRHCIESLNESRQALRNT